MNDSQALIREHLRLWGEELVDLSRRNRLLYFKHLRSTSFEFEQQALEVLDGLAGEGWAFYLPPKPDPEDPNPLQPPAPRHDELIVHPSQQKESTQIARGLKSLSSKAKAEFLDSGLAVLYVGLGMLHWRNGDQDVRSPLYLLPVELEQVGGEKTWRLMFSDKGEPALNPSLAVNLERDFDIHLPSLDDLDGDSYQDVMSAVARAVGDTNWSVEPTAVLSTFSFQKEVIYRDLRTNEDAIVDHPMVQLLAEGPTSSVLEELSFEHESEEGLDERHPPEDLFLVLDADSTQRRCVIAARDGKSFVMDGPPGTGKSQTIANIIAQLLGDGRTVLFVSEKAAALEVVQSRLSAAGLDPFLLALHSHKATRKAVAQELGAALAESPKATSRFSTNDRARLEERRRELTSYAVAVNVIRQPLGQSLHDVIGRISRLADAELVPLPDLDLAGVEPGQLERIKDASRVLSRSWGPVSRGGDFLWRDLVTNDVTSSTQIEYSQKVEYAVAKLAQLRRVAGDAYDELGIAEQPTPARLPWAKTLLQLVDSRVPVSETWLTMPDSTQVDAAVLMFADRLDALEKRTEAMEARCDRWQLLDVEGLQRLNAARDRLAEFRPAPGGLGRQPSAELDAMVEMLQSTGQCFAGIDSIARSLGDSFGVQVAPNIELAGRLATLGQLSVTDTPPEPEWFHSRNLATAAEAHTELEGLVGRVAQHESVLAGTFKRSVLDLDLLGLHARFQDVHTGLKKLSGGYRSDKAELGDATVAGKLTKDHLERLPAAAEWQAAERELGEAETRHAASLGRYYPDRKTADFAKAGAALDVARKALDACAGHVDPSVAASVLAADAAPGGSLAIRGRQLARSIETLRSSRLGEWSPSAPAVLEQMPSQDAAAWCAALAELIGVFAAEVRSVEERADRPVSIAEAAGLLSDRAAWAGLQHEADGLRSNVAPVLAESLENADAKSLRAACTWVKTVRGHWGGPVHSRVATRLLVTDMGEGQLASALQQFDGAFETVSHLFAPEYGDLLRREAQVSFGSSEELLAALSSSVHDVHEWAQYRRATRALEVEGLEPVLEACRAAHMQSEEIPDTIELAVLRRWADQVVASDDRLRPGTSADRAEIQEEFKRLDKMLVANAAAGVINTCADRRPKLTTGTAGVIKQQAALKRRHKPVRTLLSIAGDAAQRIKPCFMMSPLSVSQFLPPELAFDVVIFDEASQVKEADAICSIYRGRQLIIAGDQKQLPPTSFFDRMLDAEEEEVADDEILMDFESVLDRCKAQGFASLPLDWHYRSRHEALIAYSNYSFYEGRLHTFPGAVFEAPHLGVELFKVEGIYRRGATRDNPIEAQAVVDRVLFHRRNHPDATIGVVSLSVAQQTAVEAEIERRSETEPELRELVMDDRLDGFFVKNLESVQGDERDIIILTIGYGPDEVGKITMNFGPMNKPGGERRLNVAVTRARQRVEVVASLRGSDIASDNTAIRHLGRYLNYAEHGPGALAMHLEDSLGDAESPFEEEVIRAISGLGFDPVPQVGAAGFRIDIAVRHPTRPGSYLLGVECDGAAYHSSKVARDRDRLRQSVLEGLGWTIHRIWSTAWFMDRESEIQRLQQGIDAAMNGTRPARSAVVDDLSRPVVEMVEVDFEAPPTWTTPYVEPTAQLPSQMMLEFHAPESRQVIATQVEDVVRRFGPVHYEAVLRAVRLAWGLNRAGARMRDAFDDAIVYLNRRDRIEMRGTWLSVAGQSAIVRVPHSEEGTRRPVSEVPPEEIKLALCGLLRDAGSSSPASLRQTWARLCGWARTGNEIELAFDDAIDDLRTAGILEGLTTLSLAPGWETWGGVPMNQSTATWGSGHA